MGASTAERPTATQPEVKLTHTMSVQDVEEIARITGGEIRNPGINSKPYYNQGEEKGPQFIKYPSIDAEIDFIGGPFSVIMEAPQAFLKVDKNNISLNNSAVVIAEDSVTFVRRPQSETDRPIPEQENVAVSIVRITKDGVTYQKTTMQSVDENVMRAARMIDQAYQAKHSVGRG